MGRHAFSTKSAVKMMGENLTKMGIIENLIHGNLAIHQEIINKFIKETTGENTLLKSAAISISGGFIYLTSDIHAGAGSTVSVKLVLSLGGFEFNRFKRFLELQVNGPVTISVQGITIKARLGVELDPVNRAGASENLVHLLQYLDIKEDKITIDFNNMPGFKQILQKKLGFLLNNLEIARLELVEKMIIIHPAIKFF